MSFKVQHLTSVISIYSHECYHPEHSQRTMSTFWILWQSSVSFSPSVMLVYNVQHHHHHKHSLHFHCLQRLAFPYSQMILFRVLFNMHTLSCLTVAENFLIKLWQQILLRGASILWKIMSERIERIFHF